eukprot:scaffold3455_cov213-Prasinococcus_capsulatus_cf.AAC.12
MDTRPASCLCAVSERVAAGAGSGQAMPDLWSAPASGDLHLYRRARCARAEQVRCFTRALPSQGVPVLHGFRNSRYTHLQPTISFVHLHRHVPDLRRNTPAGTGRPAARTSSGSGRCHSRIRASGKRLRYRKPLPLPATEPPCAEYDPCSPLAWGTYGRL